MTPGARVAAAIEVLDAWQNGQPVEQALTRWARGARYAGSKDRAAVRDHVFATLRRLESAALLGGGRTGRVLMIGSLRASGHDPASLFTGVGHAPSPLVGAEVGETVAFPSPETDVPEWLRPAIRARAETQDDAQRLFAALSDRAPVWLRVNERRGSVSEARELLSTDGIETAPTSLDESALEVVSGARKLRQASAYQNGVVELQDLSAQRAVRSVAWPQTGKILDFCAGGGGKSLAITDRTDAAIYAHDAHPRRMADLPTRAARAGVHIPIVDLNAAHQHAPFDAVLCDVPCSGSGTWRRDPEAKWRLTPEGLDTLIALQASILAQAAPLVSRGGQLVYMTCSLLRKENEAQIEAFVARFPTWEVVATQMDTPLTASDGFFTAVLQRRK